MSIFSFPSSPVCGMIITPIDASLPVFVMVPFKSVLIPQFSGLSLILWFLSLFSVSYFKSVFSATSAYSSVDFMNDIITFTFSHWHVKASVVIHCWVMSVPSFFIYLCSCKVPVNYWALVCSLGAGVNLLLYRIKEFYSQVWASGEWAARAGATHHDSRAARPCHCRKT